MIKVELSPWHSVSWQVDEEDLVIFGVRNLTLEREITDLERTARWARCIARLMDWWPFAVLIGVWAVVWLIHTYRSTQ